MLRRARLLAVFGLAFGALIVQATGCVVTTDDGCVDDLDCPCGDGTLGVCDPDGVCDLGVCGVPDVECLSDLDCDCADGTGDIGICESDGFCSFDVCGASECGQDSDCAIVSCAEGDFFGFCDGGVCDDDPNDVCDVGGCAVDEDCPFVDCGDGSGDFGICDPSTGDCDVGSVCG